MKRYIALIILLAGILIPFRHVRAQSERYVNQDMKQVIEANDAGVRGDVNAESSVNNAVGASVVYWNCGIAGGEACTSDVGLIPYFYRRSALAQTQGAIAFLFKNPPANTREWLVDTGKSLGFIPRTAYAQGTGFTKLAPLLKLWKAFRNVSYLLMAIVMVVIGFMVMFRKKIDPKTVVTIQNALPRIIVTLILITFSYAIVGLLIDFMYVLISLAASIVASSELILKDGSTAVTGAELTQKYTEGGLGTLWNGLITPSLTFFGNEAGWSGFLGNLSGTGGGTVKAILGVGTLFAEGAAKTILTPVSVIKDLVSGNNVLESLFSNLFGGVAEAIGSPILFLLLAIAALFAFVRMFFMLLSAYINILLAVVIGPLQILLDAIPGGNGFSSWLKNIFANILVFPITALLLMIGTAVSAAFDQQNSTLWVAPFLPPFSEAVGKLVLSIGVALAIPTIVASIKEQFKSKPAIPVGMGAAVAPLGSGLGMGMQMMYQASFIKSAFLHKQQDDPYARLKQGGKGGPALPGDEK